MNTDNDNKIKVYVANLGKYNEGELKGGWIELPVTDQQLKAFLRDTVGVETDPRKAIEARSGGEAVYEEYAIHDFDFDAGLDKLGYRPSEHDSLPDLNLLARALEVADAGHVNIEGARALLAEEGHCPSPLECANALLQADDVPFYYYDLPMGVSLDSCTPEEAFGYQCAAQSGLLQTLADANADHCFDFVRFGQEAGLDCALGAAGYLDFMQGFPNLDSYSKDEVAGQVNPAWEALHEGELKIEQSTLHERVFGVATLSPREAAAQAKTSAQARNVHAPKVPSPTRRAK